MHILWTAFILTTEDKENASINYFNFELCQFQNILLFHYNFNKRITLALNLSSNWGYYYKYKIGNKINFSWV